MGTCLVALLGLVVSVGVGEVDVAAGFFHHFLDVVASFPDDVGVLGVGDVHFEGHTAALRETQESGGSGPPFGTPHPPTPPGPVYTSAHGPGVEAPYRKVTDLT